MLHQEVSKMAMLLCNPQTMLKGWDARAQGGPLSCSCGHARSRLGPGLWTYDRMMHRG